MQDSTCNRETRSSSQPPDRPISTRLPGRQCVIPRELRRPAQTADLPLPSAPVGALIARLHAHGSAPVLVGASREFHIAEPSHLMLGMNMSGTPPCQVGISVKVHVIPAGSSAANARRANRRPAASN